MAQVAKGMEQEGLASWTWYTHREQGKYSTLPRSPKLATKSTSKSAMHLSSPFTEKTRTYNID